MGRSGSAASGAIPRGVLDCVRVDLDLSLPDTRRNHEVHLRRTGSRVPAAKPDVGLGKQRQPLPASFRNGAIRNTLIRTCALQSSTTLRRGGRHMVSLLTFTIHCFCESAFYLLSKVRFHRIITFYI